MRAVAARLVEHGAPLVLTEVELAEPGPDEVLVDMAYGGVNPVDRYGLLGTVAPDARVPRTLGGEGAGTVEGRPVVVRGHGIGTRRDGIWATAAVVPRHSVTDIPSGVDLQRAAVMGVAGVTAWRLVTEVARVTAQDRVLVLAAGGGVGSVVVSVAHRLGAVVWGQTGDAAKADWIRARGADQVIVVEADGLLDAARELSPTVVIDALGDGFSGAAMEAAAPRARIVVFGTSAGGSGPVPLLTLYRRALTVTGYGGLIEPDEVIDAGVARALDALAQGRLEVVVDSVVPLAQVNQALDRLAHRDVRGKLVLDLRSPE